MKLSKDRILTTHVGSLPRSEKVFKLENTLTQESSLKIKGKVQADTRSDSGVEILVTDIDVVHVADEYPISLKEHGVSFLTSMFGVFIFTFVFLFCIDLYRESKQLFLS